jgi:AraC-like DNA-binding protein
VLADQSRETMSTAFQNHYTVAQLSKQWGLSQSTVLRIFKSEPGVLRIGNLRTKKRTKISLRIPEEVAARVHERLSGQNAA